MMNLFELLLVLKLLPNLLKAHIIDPIFLYKRGTCVMDWLLNFFVTPAYAADAGQAAQMGSTNFILLISLFFVFMYFTILRPQSKRAKEQQNLLGSLTKGDEVVTSGGMLGRINKITDQYIALGLANNVEVILQKSSIVGLLPKGTLKSLE